MSLDASKNTLCDNHSRFMSLQFLKDKVTWRCKAIKKNWLQTFSRGHVEVNLVPISHCVTETWGPNDHLAVEGLGTRQSDSVEVSRATYLNVGHVCQIGVT